jgi:hypothetical protein
MTSVIQPTVCSAIHSLKIKRLSITERAQRIVRNLNTSLLTFNSQESFVTPTELSMNAVLGTESAWQRDAMDSWLERPV